MTKETLIVWAVSAMLRWTLPESQREAARDRYTRIAEDAVAVVFDPAEPPLFAGPVGRVKTLMEVLSVASFESGFAESVELGRKRGDQGKSWCLMQINLGSGKIVLEGDEWRWPAKPGEGYGGQDLVEDRKRCFRTGLHMMRASIRRCRDLSLYTGGECRKDEPKAKHRHDRAVRLLKADPAPGIDDDFVAKTLALEP